MFYLKFYLKQIKQNFLLGSMHALFTILMIFVVTQSNLINEQVLRMVKTKESNPYFHALIDGKINYSRVSRKLQELPGVKFVERMNKNEVQKRTQEVLKSIELENIDLNNFNYAGIKVVLDKSLKLKSIKLIQSYLKRLVKKENLTLGSIKNRQEKAGAPHFVEYFSYYLVLVVAFIWFLLNKQFSQKIRQASYIVEQFQRKDAVALKSYLIFSLLFLIVLTLVSVSFFNAQVPYLIFFVAVIGMGSIGYRRAKWQSF